MRTDTEMKLGTGALSRPDAIDEAASLLKRLSHPSRLAIVCRLVEGEMSVAEMESELGLRQPSLSQQLGELRTAGIIAPRREAKNVVYSLADDKAARVVATLHELFCAEDAPAVRKTPTTDRPAVSLGRMMGAAVFANVQPLATGENSLTAEGGDGA